MSRPDLSKLVCQACRHGLRDHEFTNPNGWDTCWAEGCPCPAYIPAKLFTQAQVDHMLAAERARAEADPRLFGPTFEGDDDARAPRVADRRRVLPAPPRSHRATGKPRGRPRKITTVEP
jgi:hypothetical protein